MLQTPVNWNRLADPFDKEIWDKLTSQYWIDTKVPLSNDIISWGKMSEAEQETTKKVFVGLTALDTVQALVGAPTLRNWALTDHEEHVLNQISLMESIHAKSYSSIFSTLCSMREIDEAFDWGINNEYLNFKAHKIEEAYRSGDPHKIRIASTLLESFLFYSGFFWPLYLSSRKKLTNTADLIKLIIKDESVHGFYIGYKHKKATSLLSIGDKAYYRTYALEMLEELFENEEKYTHELYDDLGLAEEVKTFLKYNANKALENLGYDHIYPAEETRVMPSVLTSLAPGGESHDFFSGVGSSYQVGVREELSDDDWA